MALVLRKRLNLARAHPDLHAEVLLDRLEKSRNKIYLVASMF